MTAKRILQYSIVVILLSLVSVIAYTIIQSSPLVVGAILPLTGPNSSYGNQASKALSILEEEINSQEGVNGQTVEIKLLDSQFEEDQALQKYRELTEKYDPKGIIGAMSTSEALALSPRTKQDSIVLISPTASAPKLSGSSPFFFRVWPPDYAEGRFMARTLLNRGKECVSVLYQNSDFGQNLYKIFKNEYTENGGRIEKARSFSGDRRRFRQMIKLANSNEECKIEAIYIPAEYLPTAVILRQAENMGIDIQFFGASPSEDHGLVDAAGGAAEGFMLARPVGYSGATQKRRSFTEAFQKEGGTKPGPAATYTYDAGSVLFHAMQETGTTKPDSLAQYLRQMPAYAGVTGLVEFDEKGDVQREFELATVRNGDFVVSNPE